MKSLIITAILTAFVLPPALNAQPSPSIGLFRDENRCMGYNLPTEPYAAFECWIWIYPGPDGTDCADFKLQLPGNVAVTQIHSNPDLGTPPVPPQPWLAPGASWCFSTCQTDWFWIYKLDMVVLDVVPSFITILPHDLTAQVSSRSCLGDPEEMTVLFEFCVNHYCGPITPIYPRIKTVHLATHTALVAEFDYPLLDPPSPSQFSLEADQYPEDIEVIGAVQHPYSDRHVVLNLASPMTHGRVYWLRSYDFCSICECGFSSKIFYFDEEIPVMQSTWGAIKVLYQ